MKVKVGQSVRYVHSCLQCVILMEMSTDNPSQKSVVRESSVKSSQGCQFDRRFMNCWLGAFWDGTKQKVCAPAWFLYGQGQMLQHSRDLRTDYLSLHGPALVHWAKFPTFNKTCWASIFTKYLPRNVGLHWGSKPWPWRYITSISCIRPCLHNIFLWPIPYQVNSLYML